MPHSLKPIRRIATVTIALGLAALVLAACGSSSSNTTSSASASASAGATGTTPEGAPPQGGRFAALRQCLQKEGITLPQRKPGTPGGFLGGQGGQLPGGVSRAQLEAAIKKCGGTPGRGLGRGGLGGANLSTPAAQAALATFATCMRQHGVNLPAPNTTGKGPVFNTNGLNAASSQFRSAQTACLPALRSAVGAPPGGAGGAAPQAP
jgi:hypothetical protein